MRTPGMGGKAIRSASRQSSRLDTLDRIREYAAGMKMPRSQFEVVADGSMVSWP
jgi:hypothetical protein